MSGSILIDIDHPFTHPPKAPDTPIVPDGDTAMLRTITFQAQEIECDLID